MAQPKSTDGHHTAFYQALNFGDIQQIQSQLLMLKGFPDKDTLAYSGALKMKLAGLVNSPKEKMKYFKEGRNRLEQAMRFDSLNTEYRFLRLIIQENAPPVMRYNAHLAEDRDFIFQNFPALSPFLKKEILRYSSTSQVLLETGLKN